MKQSKSLLNVAGIDIKIHWTFSLIILFILYTNMKAGLDAYQIGWSVLFVLSLFFCVTLHELGHAMAAKRYGIKTKDITLYPIGGVARLEKMPENPKQELVVAFAGPLVNIIIAALLSPLLLHSGLENAASENALIIGATNFLPMLAIVNLWLALFNLIPAFPMDGGRVLRALLAMKMGRLKATQTAAVIGKTIAIGFVIAGFYMNPFLIFIGLFIILGAQAEANMVHSQFFISDLKAKDALMTNYQTIEKDQRISDAVKLLLDGDEKKFLVTDAGNPFGVLTRDHIIKGISDHGIDACLQKVTDSDLVYSTSNTSLNDIFGLFQQTKNPLILIMDDGKLSGIIDAENIAELIMVKEAQQKFSAA